jgi:hypothetical protein
MKSSFAIVICAALSMPVLAQQAEAMKHTNPQAEAAAQARAEARARTSFVAVGCAEMDVMGALVR